MVTAVQGPERRSLWASPEFAVARSIVVNGPISRTDIAERLNLSLPTLTRIVKPLLASGLVEEQAEVRPEGVGRPSRPLVARVGRYHFVGVKLTGDQAFAVLVDLGANELGEARRDLVDTDPSSVVRVIAEMVDELQSVTGTRVAAVGVSLGGSARDRRVVDRASFLRWHGVPLADMLEARLGINAFIENDVVALTAGEHWFGEARGLHDFAVVTIGAGVGLGMVRGDEVVRTRDVGLGLAAHIPLDSTGPLCARGHRGCATAMLSIPSMCAQYAASSGRSVSYPELIDLACSADPTAHAILSTAGSALGRFIALVSNLALMDNVVLTGDGLAMLCVAQDHLMAAIDADRDPDAGPLDLRIDRSDFARWARGAAAVAIQNALPGILRGVTRVASSA